MTSFGVKRILALLTLLLAAAPGPAGAQALLPAGAAKPLVVGHRGAAGLAPENTLAAFRRACALGVDALELDVLAAADGELVVHHDFRLNPDIARAAGGGWIDAGAPPAIRELTLAQLKTFDVGRLRPGSAYGRRYPEQQPVDGERIPTLAEAVALFKEACRPGTRLFVEIKTSPLAPALTPPPEEIAARVAARLRAAGVAAQSAVLAFDWRNLARVRQAAPEIAAVYLTLAGPGLDNLEANRPGASPWLAGLDVDDFGGSAPRAVAAAGGRIWSPHFRSLSAEALAEARRLGLSVSVWTPDSPEELRRVIAAGVDAVTTNRPDRLIELLKGP
jgi:glycerophosphoryl diester phosphodiesterase